MEQYPEHLAHYNTDSHHFNLVAKSDFWMQSMQVSAPKPTQHYHYHDSYELYYLYSGERYYFIKDKSYHVKSGNLVLINAYDIHATTNSAKYGYSRLLVNFKKDFIKNFLDFLDGPDLFECFQEDIHILKLNASEQHYVENLLQLMQQEYNTQNPGYLSYLQTSLIQLLLFINRRNHQPGDKHVKYMNATHKTISEITGYINNHYNQDISLNTISATFYISPYYFSRTFKKVTGYTFIEYLNGVRVKEAQKLLRNTNLSIADISEAVGFKSSTHFGRIFKEITGSSPLSYKRGTPPANPM